MAQDVRIIPADGTLTFYNSAGTGSGQISLSGNDLIFNNAVGDVLFGDAGSDVYIGDGVNNVDILFEQNGSIRGEAGTSITLTVGSNETTLQLTGSSLALQKDGGNIGIGTTSPDEILHIHNPVAGGGQSLAAFTNATSGLTTEFLVGINQYEEGLIWNENNKSVIFATNNGERMRILNDGKIGIGTSGPDSLLHVAKQGNANGGSMIIGLTGNGTSKWTMLAGTHYNQDTGTGNGVGSAGVALIGSLSTDTYNQVKIGGGPYEVNPATEIQFWTHTATTHNLGGSQRMTINASGNVGIGTASPVSKLHLYEAATSPTLLTLQNYQSDINPNGTQGNFIDFKMTDDNATFTPQVRIGMIVKDSDGDSGLQSEGTGNFVVYTAEGTDQAGNGTLTEHLRVTDKGNVGIGTTNPGYKLDVSGTGRITSSTDIGGHLTIQNGYDLRLQAVNNDTGDIVFVSGSGAELHRLYSGNGTLAYRANGGTTYNLIHTGNYSGTLNAVYVRNSLTGSMSVGSAATATTASFAVRAGAVDFANSATTAGSATSASHAEFADTAGAASTATTATNANNINVDEKNDNVNYQVLFSAANGSGNQRPYIDTDNTHFLYNPSTALLSGVNINGNATTATTASHAEFANVAKNAEQATTASYASRILASNIYGTYPDLFDSGTRYNIGFIDGSNSQNRDKLRVWTDGSYSIGMKNGYDYGHLGSGEYAMSFQMDATAGRGWWWGKSTQTDDEGVMALTNGGRLNVATSVSIGEGQTTTSPSTTPLYVYGSGSTIFDIQGSQGQLFSVTDSLVGSLFSVNDISGLPIIEVFDTDKVVMGTFGTNALVVSGSNVAIGTGSFDRRFTIAENTTYLSIGEKSGYNPSSYGPILETNSGTMVLPNRTYWANSNVWIDKNGSAARIHGDGGIQFEYWNGSSTSEGMRMTNTGNVGIASTAPAALLQIGGGTSGTANRSTVAMFTGASTGGVVDVLNLVNNATATYGNGTALNFNNASNYTPTGRIIVQQVPSGTITDASMIFQVYQSGLKEALKLNPNQSVTFNESYTFPIGDGTAGQALVTNGAGTLSFGTPASASFAVRAGAVDFANSATSATSASHAEFADVAGSATSATNASNINVDEKNDNVNYQVLFSANNGAGNQRPYIDTDNTHFLYNPSTALLSGVNINGNATTATTASHAEFANVAKNAEQATSAGSATSASNAQRAPYSGLYGTVPTWNQNTTGTAASATSASHSEFADNAGNLGGVAATSFVQTTGDQTISGNKTFTSLYVDSNTTNYLRMYTENNTANIADTFTDTTTDKTYIYFGAGDSSNDPGYIMHETSELASPDERNEGVLHLCPSDDNGYGDYVSIHGTNDADQIKLHTDGTIEGVGNLTASGTITATTFSGNATTATTASHAEFANVAKNAEQATSAGSATSATNADNVNIDAATTGTGYRVMFADSAGTGYERPYVHDNGFEYDPGTGTLRLSGDVVAYNSFSDRQLKDNIQTYEGGLSAVMQLNPVTYQWKKGREGQEIGLIAQEVEEVVPQVVREQQRMDEGIFKTVDYEKLVAVLIDAVQDQQRQIDELKSIIAKQ